MTRVEQTLTSFRYRAVDARGRRTRGISSATTADALARELEQRGLVVLDIGESRAPALEVMGARTPSRRDTLEATRALAALLAAGAPLARALQIGGSIVPPSIAAVLEDVRARIRAGSGVADALARHPRCFSPLYRGVVRAGERSGDLAGAFAALAAQLEDEERMRSRMLSAMIYPALLAVAGTITVVLLVRFVLPRFAELLEGAQATLPRSTAALLAMSRWFGDAWPLLVGALVILGSAVAIAARVDGGQRVLATLFVRLPLLGGFRRNVLAARFARLLSVLLGGGAPLLTALDDTVESLGDPLARDEVRRVRAAVREGRTLHGACSEGRLFPPILGRLVAVGEESGRLRDFLARSADLCQERADRTLQRLVIFVEPIMILAFGAIIAFVALSLLQAIYGIDATSFR